MKPQQMDKKIIVVAVSPIQPQCTLGWEYSPSQPSHRSSSQGGTGRPATQGWSFGHLAAGRTGKGGDPGGSKQEPALLLGTLFLAGVVHTGSLGCSPYVSVRCGAGALACSSSGSGGAARRMSHGVAEAPEHCAASQDAAQGQEAGCPLVGWIMNWSCTVWVNGGCPKRPGECTYI